MGADSLASSSEATESGIDKTSSESFCVSAN